jgi:hypothetical protein
MKPESIVKLEKELGIELRVIEADSLKYRDKKIETLIH